MAIILAYLFYFLVASASPLQRRWLAVSRSDREIGGQIDFAFRTILIVATLGLAIPFFQPFEFSGSPILITILALICGIFGSTFIIGSYVAQKHVDAGITVLISNIYTPITIILASVFLNEKLTFTQIVGTILLLFSIILISKKHRIGRFRFDKYFLFMLGSGVMLGVLLTAERALQKMTGFTSGTLLSWWSQCIFLGIAMFVTKSRTKHATRDTLITGGLKFLQALSWVMLLYIIGNLSIVSSVTTFKVVLMFILAAIFLKEREDLQIKIIGSVIAVAGLLLMG